MVRKTTNYRNNNVSFLNLIGHDSTDNKSWINESFASIATNPDYDPNIINDNVNANLLTCGNEDVDEVSMRHTRSFPPWKRHLQGRMKLGLS